MPTQKNTPQEDAPPQVVPTQAEADIYKLRAHGLLAVMSVWDHGATTWDDRATVWDS